MKTQLSARPVYVSKENCIKGHFLTCYTAVTLIRMIQKWMFKDRYSAEEMCHQLISHPEKIEKRAEKPLKIILL